MSRVDWLISITSTLFRLFSFVFLRVIPIHQCTTVLPLLYMSYSALLLLASESIRRSDPGAPVKERHPDDEDSTTSNSSPNRVRSYTYTSKYIYTLVLTLPSPSVKLRNLSLLINTALLILFADFVTHPIRYPAHGTTFARVGAVDHKSARLSVRYPGDDAIGNHSVKVLFRPISANGSEKVHWIDGPVMELSMKEDWINVTKISSLWPSTKYEYKLASIVESNPDLPYPTVPLRFETFPDPRLSGGSHFRFIATSCILPNFPYVPGKGDRIKGFDLMAETVSREGVSPVAAPSTVLPSSNDILNDTISSPGNLAATDNAFTTSEAPSTKFLLLLGDFIYADVPVYFGDSQEAYRRLYRRTYFSPSFRKVYEKLPILNIYDDHEIINNFSGHENDTIPAFPNASSAFELYNARANYDSRHKGQYYYDFRYGDVSFFVLDTRRYRSSTSDTSYPTMLGSQQIQALQSWLAEVNQTSSFKLIVSSVPFTTLWQHDAQVDTWAAFRHERSFLLESLHTVPNLFVLSGDRHEFAAIEFNGPFDWSHTIYEFSTSPLNMFYMPLIRTLSMESEKRVERTRRRPQTNHEGNETETVEEKYLIPEERVVQYLPIGNHKWTSFEIDTRDPSKPSLSAEVMIEGRVAYRWSKIGAPVATKRATSLSLFMPKSLQVVLDKFGFRPRNWF